MQRFQFPERRDQRVEPVGAQALRHDLLRARPMGLGSLQRS
jgi:hypothetical protein